MTVSIESDVLFAAVRALTRAARYDEARALLGSHSGPAFALARAEVGLALAYHGRSPDGILATLVATAREETRADPVLSWDADFLALRHAYTVEIFDPARTLGSPEGRDPAAIAILLRDAAAIHAAAPDTGRRGWAAFYLGLVHGNVHGEFDTGKPFWDEALACARSAGDEYLCFEALRHLGDYALEGAGDPGSARSQWEESAAHAAQVGGVPQVLAQQVLLARLALDRGEAQGARLLAAEVARWAEAIGAVRTAGHAREILAD